MCFYFLCTRDSIPSKPDFSWVYSDFLFKENYKSVDAMGSPFCTQCFRKRKKQKNYFLRLGGRLSQSVKCLLGKCGDLTWISMFLFLFFFKSQARWHTCNPSPGEVEIGRSRGLPGLASRAKLMSSRTVRDPVSTSGPVASICVHVCTHMYTCPHEHCSHPRNCFSFEEHAVWVGI